MIPTGRFSKKKVELMQEVNEYELLSYDVALEAGAVSRAVSREQYRAIFEDPVRMADVWKFRQMYPQPNGQYCWWPVVRVTVGQMTYLQDENGNLLSREFTREMTRASAMSHEVRKRYPEEYDRWNKDMNGREPHKGEKEFEEGVDEWLKQFGNAAVVACLMQLGLDTGCSPESWGLNSVVAWLYWNGTPPRPPPVSGYQALRLQREQWPRTLIRRNSKPKLSSPCSTTSRTDCCT